MSQSEDYAYSEIAIGQLDALEDGPDARLYNTILDICEGILDDPGMARATAAVITSDGGLRFRSFVPGGYPYKVFWSLDNSETRIEVVLRYEQ